PFRQFLISDFKHIYGLFNQIMIVILQLINSVAYTAENPTRIARVYLHIRFIYCREPNKDCQSVLTYQIVMYIINSIIVMYNCNIVMYIINS
ncbi:hypothetical protein L9F63_014499, partial [Diploptera punctata]